MDGDGDVSNVRGGGSEGGTRAVGKERRGGVVGAAEAVRRVLRVLASHKLKPVRTCTQKRVREARAAAKGAGAAAGPCSSGLQPWGSAEEDGWVSGAEAGPGPGHAF